MVLMSSITSPAVRLPDLLGVASKLLDVVAPSLVSPSAAASLANASVGLVFNLIVPERSLANGICTSVTSFFGMLSATSTSCSIGVGSGWTVAVGLGNVPQLLCSVVPLKLPGLPCTCTVVCITVGEGKPQDGGGEVSNW